MQPFFFHYSVPKVLSQVGFVETAIMKGFMDKSHHTL